MSDKIATVRPYVISFREATNGTSAKKNAAKALANVCAELGITVKSALDLS